MFDPSIFMAVSLEYVSLSDLDDVMTKEEQAEATDDGYGSSGTVTQSEPTRNEPMVKRFLKRAESLADSYLIHYDRPISDPPATLKYTVLVITRYLLDDRGDGAVSDEVQRSYDQAMQWLMDIRDGKIDLGGDVEEQGEVYYGDRVGGTFGESIHSDKSPTIRSTPLT